MKQIKIAGMSCGHCVSAVKSALEGLGMTGVEVDLAGGTASFAPTNAVSEDQVRAAVSDEGFEVESFS